MNMTAVFKNKAFQNRKINLESGNLKFWSCIFILIFLASIDNTSNNRLDFMDLFMLTIFQKLKNIPSVNLPSTSALARETALWYFYFQNSHWSHKTAPCKCTMFLHAKISAQAFCSSYCFVICCTTRKHLAIGMIPFSRRSNMKKRSRTQKANQTHTYKQNKTKQKKTKTPNPKQTKQKC